MPPFSPGSGGSVVPVVAAPSECRGTGSVLGGGRQEAGGKHWLGVTHGPMCPCSLREEQGFWAQVVRICLRVEASSPSSALLSLGTPGLRCVLMADPGLTIPVCVTYRPTERSLLYLKCRKPSPPQPCTLQVASPCIPVLAACKIRWCFVF